ncbi:sensor histidine kinase [Actinoallomurus iriomotensis]|nr:sensor histidine kinase [Actinoallomurus iriomotensis]
MPTAPRPPLLRRMPPRVRTVLAWCGVGAYPILLCLQAVSGPHDPAPGLFGTRYLLPALVVLAPAGLLRRRPLTGLTLMLVPLVLVATRLVRFEDFGYQLVVRNIQVLAIDVAVGVIAAGHRRKVSVTAAAVALLVQVACATFYEAGPFPMVADQRLPTTAAGMALVLVVVWQIGHSVRQRREYAEARREQAATQAVQAERLRIARELHDMIAHSIGVIAIQAGVGSRVMDTQPAEARNALNAIEDTSRETLAGLRRMLGALRRTEPGSAPRDPSPGLADLDGLVARSAEAGVRVDVRRLGEELDLPADIDLSAFRIVQEAVTNVIRHAGADECRVVLDHRDEELRIEVTDDGRGDAGTPGTGYGIAGMRERAALLDGRFSAGPRPEGGFFVSVRLPIPAGVR